MARRILQSLHIGDTRLFRARKLCPESRLFFKLESENAYGSVKDRTGFFLIKEILEKSGYPSRIRIVESTSGNLGISLCALAKIYHIELLCLVDPTIPSTKVEQLREAGADVEIVSLGDHPDYRTARIAMAKTVAEEEGYIWTNQYSNPACLKAHRESTGPEIWEQTKGMVDIVVCPVGTGGSICGIGQALKQLNPEIKMVAVEPLGSSIFGGKPGDYLSVGAGLRGPSNIIKSYGDVIDFHCHVTDQDAIAVHHEVLSLEGLNIGITAGASVAVGRQLSCANPDKIVVALVPDGGERYEKYLNNSPRNPSSELIKLVPCVVSGV